MKYELAAIASAILAFVYYVAASEYAETAGNKAYSAVACVVLTTFSGILSAVAVGLIIVGLM
jgi:hypothetical protein